MQLSFISVVIPVYNRARLLELVLHPLFEQTYPRNRYEIIVVDDGSTDDSASQAETLGRSWGGNFMVLRQHNQGPGAARNTGIKAASGDLVACIDSDCEAEPQWLDILAAEINKTQADAIGGPIIVGNRQNRVCRYYAAAEFYRPRMQNGEVEYLITGNVIFRRAAILDVGGFEHSGMLASDDVDLSYRLKKAGHQLAMSQRGSVIHYGDPTTLRAFWRRLFQHGYYSVPLARRWPGVRPPLNQFVRHAGAIVLSPILAFRAAQRDSILWFPWFWLCVVIQHTAFCAGILNALRKGEQ